MPTFCVPELTVTILPEPIHATSLEVGTWPADQLEAVCQVPSAGPVHVLVHSAADAELEATASRSRPIKEPRMALCPSPARLQTRHVLLLMKSWFSSRSGHMRFLTPSV